MTKIIWIWTFIIAFPIKVAEKNVLNAILKWPHVIPAKSNKGLGMEAQAKTVINPYFCNLSKINNFILSINVI